jgi:hypothetical protein
MAQEGRRERALEWFKRRKERRRRVGQEKGEEKKDYSELGRGKRETVSRSQEKEEEEVG